MLQDAAYKFLTLIASWVPRILKTPTTHIQFPVGAGYYAMRKNISAAGIMYFKLVQATTDLQLVPSIGSRTDRPSTRRSRRNVPIVA